MNRRRPGLGGPPTHLRVSADFRSAMADFAARIRAGEYSAEDLEELEGNFRVLAESTAPPDGPSNRGRRDKRLVALLSAGHAAAEDVLEAINANKSDQEVNGNDSDQNNPGR